MAYDTSNTPDPKYPTKICRLDGKGKIMDVQDMLEVKYDKNLLREGKIVLNFTEYDTATHKASQSFRHFVDPDAARVLFGDILNFRFRKDPSKPEYFIPLIDEFKGGSGKAAGHDEWEWASRKLTVTYSDKLRIGPGITFSFCLGEGKKTETGAIMPVSRDYPFSTSFVVPLANARKAAASVLSYMDARFLILLSDSSPKAGGDDYVPEDIPGEDSIPAE